MTVPERTFQLNIDGCDVTAREGQSVLEAARGADVFIPTLCYHPAVTPYGACRLCLVEVKHHGRARLVTSCCYPARAGLEVSTQCERVAKARRSVMELILARAPESEPLQEMARRLGVEKSRFPTVTHSQRDCILCGLCVQVCRENIGAAAISFAGRGVNRAVAAPFLQPSEACVGCGACAAVCPVGTIRLRWHEDEVEISPFKTRLKVRKCPDCGSPVGATRYLEQLGSKLTPQLAESLSLCAPCKRRRAAKAVKQVAGKG